MSSISRLNGLPTASRTDVLRVADALESGRHEQAQEPLQRLVASFPDHPEILRLLAGWRSLRGESAQAVDAMQRAVAGRPDDALYHNTLGSVLAQAGQFDPAAAAFQRATQLQPTLAVAWYNLALVWRNFARHADAVDALEKALALAPQHIHARGMLAESMKAEGRTAEAATQFRQILAQHSNAGMAWWGLADIKTMALTSEDAAAMRVALLSPSATLDDQVAIGFALARAHEDQGQFAAALEALAQANARARTRSKWNAPEFSALVDALLAAPVATAPTQLGNEVIFIVGLPRSGSSLTEQILASHSDVQGAGELVDLPEVIAAESRRRDKDFPAWSIDATAQDWERLGRTYLDRCRHWRAGRARFTDKLPNNWLYIGAIRSMLPGARIIVCRRDPLETCLGCYRQRLVGHEYTRTFGDLAAYWRDFDRAVRHWSDRYPDSVMEATYEDLIADPPSHIRKLLGFCGLAFEPSCLAFHKSDRRVLTPSATQVREPLRNDTARSAAYGALLDPLRAELAHRR